MYGMPFGASKNVFSVLSGGVQYLLGKEQNPGRITDKPSLSTLDGCVKRLQNRNQNAMRCQNVIGRIGTSNPDLKKIAGQIRKIDTAESSFVDCVMRGVPWLD